jgi:hypothetical protein
LVPWAALRRRRGDNTGKLATLEVEAKTTHGECRLLADLALFGHINWQIMMLNTPLSGPLLSSDL